MGLDDAGNLEGAGDGVEEGVVPEALGLGESFWVDEGAEEDFVEDVEAEIFLC